jgi:hypothetical protein
MDLICGDQGQTKGYQIGICHFSFSAALGRLMEQRLVGSTTGKGVQV